MGKYLNLGNESFRTIRNGLYVDKSELISFVNSTLCTMDKLTCVSRPRRFGKSFAAKMLCAYYDKSCNSSELFTDLAIANYPDFETHLNKYDVIYLDITLFISRLNNIKNVVSDIQLEVTEEILSVYPQIKRENTLLDTMANVAEETGNRFIIIIDEWDALFREAKNDLNLQKEYIQFLRGMFKSSLTDKVIAAAYMTGILPIKKYGTQSAMTDFREYTMVSPKKLAKYVGFTEDEVRFLCDKYCMNFEETKRWYNGYYFNRIGSVYNPNSVIEAVKNEEFENYWTQTETYESLRIYIDMNEDGLQKAIMQMLGGADCKIDINTFQNDMTSIKRKDDVLTLLVHLGYLAYDSKEKSVRIPNEEIRQEFIRAVTASKHKEISKLIVNSERLLQATIDMDNNVVAQYIEEIHGTTSAPLFYNDEQALRSVIKLAYICCIDEYLRIEELPSGRGYADVVYLPKKSSAMPIMIIELKWNKSAEGAIEQIKSRNYPQVFENFGNEILLVGINYDEKSKKHTCVIEKIYNLS